jgi:plasmid stabilization system protein ParE
MSLGFALTPEAEADVQDAHAWYERQRPGRGDEFVTELRGRIDDICTTPELFGRVRGQVRAARLPHSEFIVYYRIEPSGIVVTAVQHARAHPVKWKRRR